MCEQKMFDSAEFKAHPEGGPADSGCYRVLVRGCLDASWSEWFDDLTVVADDQKGTTEITGWLADQAALHSLLDKVSNLGMVLLAVALEGSAPAGN